MGDIEQRVADLLDNAIGRVPWLNGDMPPEDVSYDDLALGFAEVMRGLGHAIGLVAHEVALLRDEITHRPPE
ncbi:MAG: hypothetical protein ACRDLF_11155 [Solirubrobacteraceae bacterium]